MIIIVSCVFIVFFSNISLFLTIESFNFESPLISSTIFFQVDSVKAPTPDFKSNNQRPELNDCLEVLQHCERLEILRLDGCPRISDSAFAPALQEALAKEQRFLVREFSNPQKVVVKSGLGNIPSRELTYPTLGKGKSSSKVTFDGIC